MKIFKPLTNCRKTALAFLAVLFCLIIKSETGFGQTVVPFNTAGANTWFCPAGVTSVTVECWGAGGSGAGGSSTGSGGGGGGGAYVKTVNIPVTPGTTYMITVGNGSTGTAGNGVAGGSSSAILSSTVTAAGGSGGTFVVGGNGVGGAGGAGGTFNGGAGANGANGSIGGGGGSSAGTAANGNNGTGGVGGTAVTGGGAGGAGSNNGNGTAGSQPGGGGGGTRRTGGTRLGGDGGDGKVVISYTTPLTYKSQLISYSLGSTTWCPGETRTITVVIKNIGTATWVDAPRQDINVGLKWNTNGANWTDYYIRQDVGNIIPGASGTYMFSITASDNIGAGYTTPLATGINNLTADVVYEAVSWFGDNGGGVGPGNTKVPSANQTIAVPTAFTVTGGGAYCSGGTGVAVGLSNSTSTVNYQLYNGAAAVGAPVAGTGAAITFGLQTAAGTYTVVATTAAGCSNTMTGNTVITITPTPNTTFTYATYSYCKTGTSPAAILSGSPQTGTFSATPAGLNFSSTSTGAINLGTSAAGTYSITYTVLAAGGCGAYTYTQPTNVVINALPTLFTVSGGGSYCSTTGGTVSLSGSQVGVNYQLYNGAATVGAPVAGTGAVLNFTSLASSGTYTIIATNPTTTCSNTMTGNAVITITPTPNTTFTYATYSYCKTGTSPAAILSGSPQTGTFSATPAGLNFSSTSTGAINLGTSAAGTYSITYTVLAAGGCGAYTYTQPTNVVINALPTLFTVSGGGSYCSTTGGTVSLSGSQVGVNYQLYNGAATVGAPVAGTGAVLNFTSLASSGTYTIIATNPTTTCSNTMTGNTVITITPTPNTTFTYATYSYCKTGTSPAAILSGSPQTGTFSATPAGLNFSSTSTGAINLGTSAAGTYSITYTVLAAGGCGAYTYTQPTNVVINALPAINAGPDIVSTCTGAGPITMTGATATGSVGSITWSGGGGLGTFSGSGTDPSTYIFTPSVPQGSFTATVTATVASPCSGSNVTDTRIISWGSAGSWIGVTSTDWNISSNWCGNVLPGIGTNVNIPAVGTVLNQPVISNANANCQNIIINGTLGITTARTLNVYGDWTNNGVFTTTNSTVNFTGGSNNIITGTASSAFWNLIVNKTATANTLTSINKAFAVGSDLTVTQGNLILQATNANYTVSNNINVAAPGILTHSVDWNTGFLLSVGGSIAIDGIFNYTVRSHVQMISTGIETIRTGANAASAFSILTLLGTGTFNANGTIKVNDNFYPMYGNGGSFHTNNQTVTALAAALVNGGTLYIDGGTLNVTGGLFVGNGNVGTVNFSAGTLNVDNVTVGSATTGTFLHSGGTANINGNLLINNTTGVSNYTCTGSPTINITGNWTNNETNAASFVAATSQVNFNGSAVSTIAGLSPTFYNLSIANAAGVNLSTNTNVSHILNLSNGIVTTGGNTLSATSTTAGSVTGGSAASYVNGRLAQAFNSNISKIFPVGKGGNYRPVTFAYSSLTGTSTVTVEQIESSIGTPTAPAVAFTARHWDITQSGGTNLDYKVTLNDPAYSPIGFAKILKEEGAGAINAFDAGAPNYTNVTGFTTFNNTNNGTNSFALGWDCSSTADAGAALTDICQGGTSDPLGGSKSGTATGAVWSDGGVGGTFSPNATTLNATWTPPAAYFGTATLTLTPTGGLCAPSTPASKTQVVNPLPTGTFAATEISGTTANDNIICTSAPVTFTFSNSTYGSYIFKVNGVTKQTGTGNSYSSSTLANGDQVTVDVANGFNCGKTFGPITITVNALTTPTLVSNKSSICPGDQVIFTATPAGAGNTYNFKLNGSSVQSGSSNTYTTTSLISGNLVTVDLTNANGCTATSAPVSVTINSVPSGSLTATETSGTANDNKICAGSNIDFTATPLVAGYTYNFKVNGASVQSTGSNVYSTTTLTNGQVVTVDVNNGSGCAASFGPSQVITVYALPTGTLTATENSGTANDNTICAGSNVTFTATSGYSNYAFYLKGTGAALYNGPLNTYSITSLLNGDYFTVVVTGINNGCTSTFTSQVITVNAIPSGTLTASANPICAGDQVDFTATPGFGNYNFKVNGVSFSNGSSNIASYTGFTNGNVVTVTVTNNGCTSVFNSITINVNPLPTGTLIPVENSGNAPNDSAICKGDTVIFTATSGYSNYNFKLNGTTVQYSTGNTYSTDTLNNGDVVSVEVTNATGCLATFNYNTITVNNLPGVPPIAGRTSVCVSDTIHLSDATAGGVWSSSNNTIATVNSSGIVTGIAAGTDTIYYTVTNANGCSKTVNTIITVNALPIVGPITGLFNICTNTYSQLSDITPGGVWSSSNNLVATIDASGLVRAINPGTAIISYVVTNASGCNAMDTALVTVAMTPVVAPITTTAPSFDVCVGSTIKLNDATSGGVWRSSDLTLATISSTGVVTGVAAGTDTIFYTINTTCNTVVEDTQTIIVHALPIAYTVTGGGAYCNGGTGVLVGLSNSETGVNYQLKIGGVNTGSPLAGTTGSAISFGLQTAAGTYTVVATNATTGCTSNMTGSVTVSVNPLPTVYNVTGGGAYCSGGTGVVVGLNNSQTGVNYQLQIGGVNTGSSVAGTNAAISFGLQTAAGTYTVIATNATTGCTSNMNGSVIVSINPLPTVYNVTGGGAYCSGGTGVLVGLNNSETGVNYQLKIGGVNTGSPVAGTNAAISFGLQTAAGTYTVFATNATTGCTSNMNGSVLVSVNPLPTAYNVTGGGAYCSGGTGVLVGLSNSQTGVNYQLKIGGVNTGSPVAGTTGSAISFGLQTAAGTYTVVATNATTGCTSNMNGSVTVSISPLPTAYTVTGGGSYCSGGSGVVVGLSNSQTGVNYQLQIGGVNTGSPVAGTTGSAISFGLQTAAGTYTVVATNASIGCTNTMTGSVTISITAVPTIGIISASPATVCPGGSSTLSIAGAGATTIVNYNFNSGISYVTLAPALASGITSTVSGTATFGTAGGTASGANAFTANPTGNALTTVPNKTWIFTLGGTSLSDYKTYKVYYQASRNTGGNNTVTVAYSLNGGAFTSTGITATVGANPLTIGSSGTYNEVLLNVPATADNPTTSLAFQLSVANSGTGNVQLDNFQIQAVPSTTYFWTASPSGASAGLPVSAGTPSLTNNIITVNPTVTTNYTVTATNATGCSSTKTATVNVYAVPTVTITANYCAVAGKVQLTANTTPAGTYNYQWYEAGSAIAGATASVVNVDIADLYTVKITTTNGCIVTDSISVAQELVINGDFTNGNTGFTSDYAYKPDIGGPLLVPAGQGELYDDTGINGYSITPDGSYVHTYFFGQDHTGAASNPRNFMAVNGHGNTLVVWKETVNVLPNTTYYFSAWAMSLNDAGPFAQLKFNVNGVLVGTTAVLSAGPNSGPINGWTRFYGTWTSGPSTTSANIQINDLQSSAPGNDFGLDDISFGTLSTFLDLESATGTDAQSICVNTPLIPIIYSFGNGNSNPTVSGLPAGVSVVFAGDKLTISGTPTVAGNYTYSVTTTTCSPFTVTGTITVNQQKLTLTSGSATQTICINTPITNIVYTAVNTDGTAVTNVIVKGLPTGLTTGSGYSPITKTITISGSPSVAGIFKDTVITVGNCKADTAYGTITVQQQTIVLSSGSSKQTVCVNNSITTTIFTFGTATGASITSGALPAGVTGIVSGSTFIISGTPTVSAGSPYIVTITTSGTCNPGATAKDTIYVNPDATITLSSAIGTDVQTVCNNTAITPITYTIGGGGTSATVSGLPANVTGNYSAGIFTISGTPNVTGIYNYTITTTGTCAQTTATGTITVQVSTIDLTSGSASQTVCLGSGLINIVFTTGGGVTGASISWSPSVPTGIAGNYAGGTYTISGSPTTLGTYNYTITTSGGCAPNASTSGIITINNGTVGGTLPALVSICSGGGGALNLTGQTGTVQKWEYSTNGGTTWITVLPNNTSTTLAYSNIMIPTQYRALVKSGSCNALYSTIALIGIHNYWTGATSTNWSVASNWSDNQMPSFASCNTVIIPFGSSNPPQLTSNVIIPNLNIAPGISLNLNGFTLEIDGTFTGSNTGNLKGGATSGLIIGGNAGSLYFDVANNVLQTLKVNNGATATISNALNITGGTAPNTFGIVTVNGTLTSSGTLTLKSNQYGDAVVGQSTGTVSGIVTVERYIPYRRAWRFLGVPVNSTQTVNQAWQEGQTNPDVYTQINPNPGFGTDITYAGTNGYDPNITTNPSIKTWVNGAWFTPNLTYIGLNTYSAYCLFVRGSRAVNLSQGIYATVQDNTVLRAFGTLNQTNGNLPSKTYTSTLPNDYVFIGNPYASSIDLQNIIDGSRVGVSGFDVNKFWVWNPKIGGANNVGGYVAYSNGIQVPPNSDPTYTAGTIIQSGQAFMLQLSSASTSASVKFQENDKSISQTNVFSKQANKKHPAIYTNLLVSSTKNLVDGVGAGFGEFSIGVDANDAAKQWNFDENIALIRTEHRLAIEMRPLPVLSDTLFYKLFLRQQPYTLQIFSHDLPAKTPLQGWLVDKYLNTKTAVNLYDTTLYNFTPNTDTNSYRNRFILVFNRTFTANPVEITKVVNQNDPATTGNAASIAESGNGVSIYPNPVATGEKVILKFSNMVKGRYEVSISNSAGIAVTTATIDHTGGGNTYSLQTGAGWAAGSYIVKITGENGYGFTTKLVISK